MKLLVIVICLLSERYLVHAFSNKRLQWFDSYVDSVMTKLEKWFSNRPLSKLAELSQVALKDGAQNRSVHQVHEDSSTRFRGKLTNSVAFRKRSNESSWGMLFLMTLPILIIAFGGLWILESMTGGLAFVLNIVIFYACLGPVNPFYPKFESEVQDDDANHVAIYLTQVNHQLFTIIFWYVLAGPIFILFYRIVSVSQKKRPIGEATTKLTNILEWVPARIACFLYLLTGNFHLGKSSFTRNFLSMPQNNAKMLQECGLGAIQCEEGQVMKLPQAETMVEHAIIILLSFLAVLTIVSWL